MKRQNKEIITDGYIYMCSYDTSITNKIFLHYFDMLRSNTSVKIYRAKS